MMPKAVKAAYDLANTANTAATAAQTAASKAQSTADEAKAAAENITVPVTSVNGQTGDVTVGTVRTVNGVSADAAGNVAITLASLSGLSASAYSANSYITLSNGFQICLGSVTTNKSGTATSSFPKGFSSNPKVFLAAQNSEYLEATPAITSVSTTSFNIDGTATTTYYYAAIGHA